MRRRNKRVTRSQTGAKNPETLIALCLQPVETAAHVDHPLARCVEGASDVGGDRVVGAANLSGTTDVVIWHAQPQYGNSKPIKNSRQTFVTERVGIPLRKQHQRTFPVCRKPARIGKIVLRIRRADRRSETKKLAVGAADFFLQLGIGNLTSAEDLHLAFLQAKIRRLRVRKKLVAGGDRTQVVLAQVVFALFRSLRVQESI